ncbi:MAG: MoaD/ThiS family protein [Deltaproteobacteria bacterium]|nr:MoaD/ThiS family protein [Deltaproteobacteria bacterium]
MINVKLRVGGGVGGRTRVEPSELLLPEGTTVQDVIKILCDKIGIEELQPSGLVAVNGHRVGEKERANWALRDGDVMSVVAAFAGG